MTMKLSQKWRQFLVGGKSSLSVNTDKDKNAPKKTKGAVSHKPPKDAPSSLIGRLVPVKKRQHSKPIPPAAADHDDDNASVKLEDLLMGHAYALGAAFNLSGSTRTASTTATASTCASPVSSATNHSSSSSSHLEQQSCSFHWDSSSNLEGLEDYLTPQSETEEEEEDVDFSSSMSHTTPSIESKEKTPAPLFQRLSQLLLPQQQPSPQQVERRSKTQPQRRGSLSTTTSSHTDTTTTTTNKKALDLQTIKRRRRRRNSNGPVDVDAFIHLAFLDKSNTTIADEDEKADDDEEEPSLDLDLLVDTGDLDEASTSTSSSKAPRLSSRAAMLKSLKAEEQEYHNDSMRTLSPPTPPRNNSKNKRKEQLLMEKMAAAAAAAAAAGVNHHQHESSSDEDTECHVRQATNHGSSHCGGGVYDEAPPISIIEFSLLPSTPSSSASSSSSPPFFHQGPRPRPLYKRRVRLSRRSNWVWATDVDLMDWQDERDEMMRRTKSITTQRSALRILRRGIMAPPVDNYTTTTTTESYQRCFLPVQEATSSQLIFTAVHEEDGHDEDEHDSCGSVAGDSISFYDDDDDSIVFYTDDDDDDDDDSTESAQDMPWHATSTQSMYKRRSMERGVDIVPPAIPMTSHSSSSPRFGYC